jgi:hypothetical protein
MNICQRCGAPVLDGQKESSDSIGNSGDEKQIQLADVDAPFHNIVLLGVYHDEPADSGIQAWAVLRLSLPEDESLAN